MSSLFSSTSDLDTRNLPTTFGISSITCGIKLIIDNKYTNLILRYFVWVRFVYKYQNYNIPITYLSYKRVAVEAENLQEAVEKALKQFLSEPDEQYLQDSFEVDGIIEEETGETYNMEQVYNNI